MTDQTFWIPEDELHLLSPEGFPTLFAKVLPSLNQGYQSNIYFLNRIHEILTSSEIAPLNQFYALYLLFKITETGNLTFACQLAQNRKLIEFIHKTAKYEADKKIAFDERGKGFFGKKASKARGRIGINFVRLSMECIILWRRKFAFSWEDPWKVFFVTDSSFQEKISHCKYYHFLDQDYDLSQNLATWDYLETLPAANKTSYQTKKNELVIVEPTPEESMTYYLDPLLMGDDQSFRVANMALRSGARASIYRQSIFRRASKLELPSNGSGNRSQRSSHKGSMQGEIGGGENGDNILAFSEQRRMSKRPSQFQSEMFFKRPGSRKGTGQQKETLIVQQEEAYFERTTSRKTTAQQNHQPEIVIVEEEKEEGDLKNKNIPSLEIQTMSNTLKKGTTSKSISPSCSPGFSLKETTSLSSNNQATSRRYNKMVSELQKIGESIQKSRSITQNFLHSSTLDSSKQENLTLQSPRLRRVRTINLTDRSKKQGFASLWTERSDQPSIEFSNSPSPTLRSKPSKPETVQSSTREIESNKLSLVIPTKEKLSRIKAFSTALDNNHEKSKEQSPLEAKKAINGLKFNLYRQGTVPLSTRESDSSRFELYYSKKTQTSTLQSNKEKNSEIKPFSSVIDGNEARDQTAEEARKVRIARFLKEYSINSAKHDPFKKDSHEKFVNIVTASGQVLSPKHTSKRNPIISMNSPRDWSRDMTDTIKFSEISPKVLSFFSMKIDKSTRIFN